MKLYVFLFCFTCLYIFVAFFCAKNGKPIDNISIFVAKNSSEIKIRCIHQVKERLPASRVRRL